MLRKTTNKKKKIMSFALAIAIGLSAGAGMIAQKSSADDNLESFAQAQTATETITPKMYDNFKMLNESETRTPTNSFKSEETTPTLRKDIKLYLKVNLPVRCRLNLYAKHVGDDSSSTEIEGTLYNANGVKQNRDKVLDAGLYYYAVSWLTNLEDNPYWKVYAYYIPSGEELTEAGQKYIAYGDGDRLNKAIPRCTIGKISYADGPTTYKIVAKDPGAVYLELFDEYAKGSIEYLDSAKLSLYDSKMKLIGKEPSQTEDYKLSNGSLNINHFFQGVAFNLKKKGTYYLKMTNYTGPFAYHMRFLKGATCKLICASPLDLIFTKSPSQLVNRYLKKKSSVYWGGSNNLYINEPPLMAVNITNLNYKDRKTNIIRWKKVKTAQKYLIRRVYDYHKNGKLAVKEYKKKYTKKTYFKMTKKDMEGRKLLYVDIRPVRNGKIGTVDRAHTCYVAVNNNKGKMLMSLTSNETPFW